MMGFELPSDIRAWVNFMLDTVYELRAENAKLKKELVELKGNYEILASQLEIK